MISDRYHFAFASALAYFDCSRQGLEDTGCSTLACFHLLLLAELKITCLCLTFSYARHLINVTWHLA